MYFHEIFCSFHMHVQIGSKFYLFIIIITLHYSKGISICFETKKDIFLYGFLKMVGLYSYSLIIFPHGRANKKLLLSNSRYEFFLNGYCANETVRFSYLRLPFTYFHTDILDILNIREMYINNFNNVNIGTKR